MCKTLYLILLLLVSAPLLAQKNARIEGDTSITIIDSITWQHITEPICYVPAFFMGTAIRLDSANNTLSVYNHNCTGKNLVDKGSWKITHGNTLKLKMDVGKNLQFKIMTFFGHRYFVNPKQVDSFKANVDKVKSEMKNRLMFTTESNAFIAEIMLRRNYWFN